jgi:hypothetical protein
VACLSNFDRSLLAACGRELAKHNNTTRPRDLRIYLSKHAPADSVGCTITMSDLRGSRRLSFQNTTRHIKKAESASKFGNLLDSLSLGICSLTLSHVGVSGCSSTRCRPTSPSSWQSRVDGGVAHVDPHHDQPLRDLCRDNLPDTRIDVRLSWAHTRIFTRSRAATET